MDSSWRTALLEEASRPYRKVGPGWFAYFFARGKLRVDPVYRAILELGLLTGRPRILDLGCGQGLLTAWLLAARRLQERGRWPAGWPAAPQPLGIRGIELMARDVERARCALGSDVDITEADIRDIAFETADAVVVLDVLHYLKPDAQQDILRRIRAALSKDGLLLLRVSDAGAGLRYRYTRWVDKLVMLVRGHSWLVPHCRSATQWQALLHGTGFESEALPMSGGTPFANVLLIARPSSSHVTGDTRSDS